MILHPPALWTHFHNLCRIGRCSGHEEAAASYVLEVAAQAGLEAARDARGNVVVRKPGHGGSPVVLQAHLDMVCERAQGVSHEFGRDHIRVVHEEGWVRAEGTSLGADNGVGVAAALAVLTDPSLRHPPLEALFTVEEEVGLRGAREVSPDLVTGRMLINLDAEREEEIVVGCAGGADVRCHRTLTCYPEVMVDGASVEVCVEGLRGGHSGLDIHRGRGNAIQILAHALLSLLRTQERAYLVDLQGGTKSNAIPRHAKARVILPGLQGLEDWAGEQTCWWRQRLGGEDPDVVVRVSETSKGPTVLTEDSTGRVVRFLAGFPHGVWEVDEETRSVATSCNLAITTVARGHFDLVTSVRASSREGLAWAKARVGALVELFGCEPREEHEYPPWPRSKDSHLLRVAEEAFRAVHGRAPRVRTVHAGLECAVLSLNLPGLDAISVGPTILDPHSPSERVEVASVGRFWDWLVELLARLVP